MEQNISSFPEMICRLLVAVSLVPIILYLQWLYLVFVPFYILATTLAGSDPVKALVLQFYNKLFMKN